MLTKSKPLCFFSTNGHLSMEKFFHQLVQTFFCQKRHQKRSRFPKKMSASLEATQTCLRVNPCCARQINLPKNILFLGTSQFITNLTHERGTLSHKRLNITQLLDKCLLFTNKKDKAVEEQVLDTKCHCPGKNTDPITLGSITHNRK